MSEHTVVLEQPAPPPAPATNSSKGRAAGVVALLVVAALLCTPALVAYWGQRTLNDTERFVATTGPLVDSPEVQEAVVQQVTKALQDQVDVQALLTNAFAGVIQERPRVQLLIGPLSGAINSLIETQVRNFVASDAFADIWVRVSTRTQQALLKVLKGEDTGAVSVQGDQVVLDVSDVIDQVKQRLVDRGLTFAENVPIPQADRQIVLLTSSELNQAQNIYAFTNPVAKWLIWVVVLMLLGAVLLSVRKARTTVWVGAILLANGLLVGLALSIGRQAFVNELSGTTFGPASKVFYDQLLTYLMRGGKAMVLLGVLVIICGWYAGRTATARVTRGFIVNGLESVGAAFSVSQVRDTGRWVAANIRWLRVVIGLLATVVLVWGNAITRERLFWSFVLMIALLAVAQVLVGAGKAPAEPTDTPVEEDVPAPV